MKSDEKNVRKLEKRKNKKQELDEKIRQKEDKVNI